MTRRARGTSNRAKGNIKANAHRIAWSVREFAATIGVNYQTALAMVHNGDVGYFKAGGEYRIPQPEIDRLLSEASARRPQPSANPEQRESHPYRA
jgi:excisionase family DNA binding protein